MLAASNSLGERQDQFLQRRRSKRDSRQIQDKNLGLIRTVELRGQTIANCCRTSPILEQQSSL